MGDGKRQMRFNATPGATTRRKGIQNVIVQNGLMASGSWVIPLGKMALWPLCPAVKFTFDDKLEGSRNKLYDCASFFLPSAM